MNQATDQMDQPWPPSNAGNESSVTLHASGGASFTGKDSVHLFRAITLKASLNLFAKTGMKPTRGVGGPQLRAIATEYTGQAYKRGEEAKAAEDVRVWIETMKAAMPISRPTKRFSVNGGTATLDAMLEANAEDLSLCAWLQTAAVGDHFPDGIGCTRLPDGEEA